MKQMRINRKLMLVYALNVADWICTVALLRTGMFYEANPLMRQFVGSIPTGFALKCLFPALLLFIVGAAVTRLEGAALRTADRFISFLPVFYLAVDFDHVMNFLLLIFQKYS